IYGEDCLCQPIELNRKSKSSEYQQDLTTKQSLDFSFVPNFSTSSSLPIINNNKIVEVEAPVTIEVPVVKTPDVMKNQINQIREFV
ncbi:10252_t:CDS:2, partial [Racocetra fulgida]